jgi:Trk K+ transport system NAD-binding subunit
LEDEGIHVTLMPDPDIQSPKQTFHYLFALSLNDVDNVLMCRIGEKVYHIKKFISICNDPKNEKIYQTSGIPFCSGEGITAQMLVRTVLVKKEEKTCQEN